MIGPFCNLCTTSGPVAETFDSRRLSFQSAGFAAPPAYGADLDYRSVGAAAVAATEDVSRARVELPGCFHRVRGIEREELLSSSNLSDAFRGWLSRHRQRYRSNSSNLAETRDSCSTYCRRRVVGAGSDSSVFRGQLHFLHEQVAVQGAAQ